MKMGKKVKVNIFKPLSSWEDFGENVDDTSILGNANYLGSLYPTKAVVTEELNGNFYLEVEFLRDEASADLIKFENLIVVYGLPVLDKLPQAFRIKNYKVNRKKFTLTAKHRFYDTENYIIKQTEELSFAKGGFIRTTISNLINIATIYRHKPENLSDDWSYPTEAQQSGGTTTWRETSFWSDMVGKFYERKFNADHVPPYTGLAPTEPFKRWYHLLCLRPFEYTEWSGTNPLTEAYLAHFESHVGYSMSGYVNMDAWADVYNSGESTGSWSGEPIVGDWDNSTLAQIYMQLLIDSGSVLYRSNENYGILRELPPSSTTPILLRVGRNIKSLEVEYNYDNFANVLVSQGWTKSYIEDTSFYGLDGQAQLIDSMFALGALDVRRLGEMELTDAEGNYKNLAINEFNASLVFAGNTDPTFRKLYQSSSLASAKLIHAQNFKYDPQVAEERYSDAQQFARDRSREFTKQLKAKMRDCCEPKKIFTIDVVDDPRYRDGGKSLINSIYDQATVVDDVLGINETMQVYAYKWNVLLDRVESLTLGAIPKKLKDYI